MRFHRRQRKIDHGVADFDVLLRVIRGERGKRDTMFAYLIYHKPSHKYRTLE